MYFFKKEKTKTTQAGIIGKLISDSIYTLLGDQTRMFFIISQSKPWALPGWMRATDLYRDQWWGRIAR